MTRSTGLGRGGNPASWNNTKRGGDHHRWNEGRLFNADGYVKLRVGTGHPLADANGYAYEHLVVWVSAGRLLPSKGELLHHRNENRADNRLDNLERMTRGEHSAEHIETGDRRDPASGRLRKSPHGVQHDGYPA